MNLKSIPVSCDHECCGWTARTIIAGFATNKQTNLHFIILLNFAVVINVVGDVFLRDTSAMFLCSCNSRKDNWRAVFCQSIGRVTVGYFSFSVGVPVKKWLTSWITCIVWLSFFLRATDKHKKDFELCHCYRSGGGSGYCWLNVFTKHPSLITVYQYLKGKIGIVAEYVVRRF
jgi:hypothetical protein